MGFLYIRIQKENKFVDIETYVDGISGSLKWCAVINDPREEAGVVLGGGKTYIFHHLSYHIAPVLGRSPHAVRCFIEQSEVVGTGVGIAKGWVDDGDIVL